MPIPFQQPEERQIVGFRVTLPVVLSFVITMIIIYVLGQAPEPYYQAASQSIRVDVIASQNAGDAERVEVAQQEK